MRHQYVLWGALFLATAAFAQAQEKYPAPRYPKIPQVTSVEDLLPTARVVVRSPSRRETLRPGYGVKAGERVLQYVDRMRLQEPRRLDAVSTAAPMTLPPDRQLVERLRQLRSELAEEEGVAPFLIFHDKTLKAIAGSKPETPAALLEIPGIGEMKAERYGRRVLAVINEG